MFKTELLAPAGNMETLKAAVQNGADAVYIGGKMYGARAFANNFTLDEIKTALKYCHLYSVKLYVTANTVIFENEIEDFLDYMKFLYESGVDAVIMQDLGMISLVRKLIPDLEIHASTQINVHNDESLFFLKNMGVKRAVLAREMSIDEIKNLKCDIEKEIFIHGALCVSYSGQCLFSSLNGGRSGNRGECTQSCRLPYENNKTKNYYLSTKELCSVNHIKEILDLKINSLKIEGRMKSPTYVGYVTRIYRRLIDDYYKGLNPKITPMELYNLTTLFNRKFTDGYLFNDNIYNIKSPNHLGSHLGIVIKITKDKIFVKLDEDLYQEDGIRFCSSNKGMIINKLYNEKGLLVNHVCKGDIAILDNKVNLKEKDSVNKTISKNLIKLIENTVPKKIPISFKVFAKAFNELTLTVTDDINTITLKSIKLDKALNKPTTKEEIYSKLNKLGNTPFYLKSCEINLDNAFIPMKILNNLKRDIIDKLILKRTEKENKINFKYEKHLINENNNIPSFFVRNEEQLKMVLGKGRIYTEDFKLYKKYKNPNVFYKLPRIMYEFPDFKGENLLISELGGIYKYSKDNFVIADYPLNITNSETVNFLHNIGVKISTISPEVKGFELEKYSYPTEKIVYGKPDLMILKNFNKDIKYLKNSLNNYFPIIHGKYTTILHHKNINLKGKGRMLLYDEKEINLN